MTVIFKLVFGFENREHKTRARKSEEANQRAIMVRLRVCVCACVGLSIDLRVYACTHSSVASSDSRTHSTRCGSLRTPFVLTCVKCRSSSLVCAVEHHWRRKRWQGRQGRQGRDVQESASVAVAARRSPGTHARVKSRRVLCRPQPSWRRRHSVSRACCTGLRFCTDCFLCCLSLAAVSWSPLTAPRVCAVSCRPYPPLPQATRREQPAHWRDCCCVRGCDHGVLDCRSARARG